MKNLKIGFFVNRDKSTETMKPVLLRVLARTVLFPDGTNLLDRWESSIDTTVMTKHTDEVAYIDASNNFKWRCSTCSDGRFQLVGRFRPSIENQPVSIGNDSGSTGSITLTKISEDGDTTSETIPYGSNAVDQYIFTIAMPSTFAGGKTPNFDIATFNITEGSDSTFINMNTVHSVFSKIENGDLVIKVNHFKGVDAVDMTGLSYISGDFSILINGVLE